MPSPGTGMAVLCSCLWRHTIRLQLISLCASSGSSRDSENSDMSSFGGWNLGNGPHCHFPGYIEQALLKDFVWLGWFHMMFFPFFPALDRFMRQSHVTVSAINIPGLQNTGLHAKSTMSWDRPAVEEEHNLEESGVWRWGERAFVFFIKNTGVAI